MMATDHSSTLQHARLHRRVKRQAAAPAASSAGGTDAQPGGGAGASTGAAGQGDTAAAAQSTTTARTTATTTAQDVIESTSSVAPSSSATTAAPVDQSSSSSTTTTTTTTTTSSTPTTTTTSAEPSTTSEPPSSTTTTTTSQAPETTSTTSETTTSSASAVTTSDLTSTTIVIVSGSAASSSSSSSALPSASKAADNGGGSSSLGTGGVIGIVAGAVVGIIVIAGVAVWLFKKKFSRDDDDDQVSPFDRDEFRRASVMLDDVDEAHHYSPHHSHGHSPQMSEYSMHELPNGAGIVRSNTLLSNGSGGGGVLPGLARGQTLVNPRPPTMIGNHYAHQQQHHHHQQQHQQQAFMPSYAPGQVVPSMPPQAYAAPGAAGGGHGPSLSNMTQMDLYGATGGPGPYHAAAAAGVGGSAAGLASASAGAWRGGGGGGGGDLSRNNSQASAYSTLSSPADAPVYVPAALRPGGSSHGHGAPGSGYPDERPLSLSLSRSGTPTNANVQQTFFDPSGGARQAQDAKWDMYHHHPSSGPVPRGVGPAAHAQSGVVGQAWSDEELSALAAGQRADEAGKRERRLSVRNGGLDAFDDDDDDAGAISTLREARHHGAPVRALGSHGPSRVAVGSLVVEALKPLKRAKPCLPTTTYGHDTR
ncbi:hypothetical protein DMC30DRAFT_449337 [Rhodotorula diobovata]|uniref:Uncharacterized protein n=1 Tax=Rhodotorula diobovata TaxID=5288 RepID=A0A5C5FM41_9BASI|nr:hypothetical protein DMC30DRAFT_449337 [Rhodotorula diobovata]